MGSVQYSRYTRHTSRAMSLELFNICPGPKCIPIKWQKILLNLGAESIEEILHLDIWNV